MRATAAEETQTGWLVLLCLASWAIPGAGHLWLGRRSKGLIFLVALPMMFVMGIALHGRLFPFDVSEWLVCLAAGMLLTVAFRWLLLRIQIVVAAPILTYPSLTALITLALWLVFFR